MLEHLDPDGETAGGAPGAGAARAVAAVEEAGGFAVQLADIEEVPARAHWARRRDFIPLPPAAEPGDPEPGIAFASGDWRHAVTDRRHPGMAVRRHFEAMMFTCLAEELRTGDIAVVGGRGVLRLAQQPPDLGRVRAATGGVLRESRPAGDRGGFCGAAVRHAPRRGCRAGRRIRGPLLHTLCG